MDAKPFLTAKESADLFASPSWAAKFPPILNVDQAAELAGVPKHTIYAWSSQERLKDCSRRAGKRLRIHRDRFVRLLFSEDFNAE
jgi:hypothetical protein